MKYFFLHKNSLIIFCSFLWIQFNEWNTQNQSNNQLGSIRHSQAYKLNLNLSTKLFWNFLLNRIFYWMTNWLMPSTRQWIRLLAWFLHYEMPLCPKTCLFTPTTAATVLIMVPQSSPLFFFVLHSFLHYYVGDDLLYACQYKTIWLHC